MATVKPFIYQGPVAPRGQPLPTLSPQQASMLEDTTAQGLMQVSEMAFSISGVAASRASSALVQSQNAQMRADLAKREYTDYIQTPEILDAIAAGADEQSIYLMKINEAKRLEDLPGLEKSFMNSASIKMQEDYLNFIQEAQSKAGPDGSGYIESINKFFNDSSLTLVDGAPSEMAKAAMLDRVQEFKLSALADGIKFESGRRKDWGVQKANEAADSLVKQAIMAPENYSAYLEQTNNLKDNLLTAGMDPADVDRWVAGAQNEVTKGYLHRRITDDPVAALEELGTSDLSNYLTGSDLITTVGRATQAIKDRQEEEQKQIQIGQAINRIESGIPLDLSNPAESRILNSYYDMATSQLRDPETGVFNQDPATTSEVIFATLQKTPGSVPDKFKSDFANAITYGNPESAQAMARLVGRMSSEPTMARTLSGLDDKSVQMALLINSSLTSGTSITDAVTDARKQVLVATGSVESSRMKEADAYLTKETIDKNLQGEFSSWFAPIVGFGEFLNGGAYGTQGAKFFDPENLDVAHAEYRRMFKQAYTNTGDADTADKFARLNLHKSFAVTTANGQAELMPYAPQVVFPGYEADFNEKLTEVRKAYPDQNVTIDSRDYFGNNYAQLNGTYPLYYTDADGIKRPMLSEDGVQLTFNYGKGLTPDQKAAIDDMKNRAKAIEEMHKAGYSGLDQISKLVRAEAEKKNLTPEQKYLLDTQLRVTFGTGK